MKTILVIIAVVALFALSAGVALAGGPAMDAGDGTCDNVCDGPQGPNCDEDGGRGPAPNAGDGVPDGSGF